MTNFFSILFFCGDGSSFNDTFREDDFFGIVAAYGLIEVPNTPQLQIINGFLSNEDANKIYDYDT